jgi:type IV secretion system protein VirB9
MMRACAAALAVCAITAPATAQQQLASAQRQDDGAVDARIRIIPYSADSIVSLRGHLGYQMLIEFDPGERIENVAIGDSVAWQVTPNRAATMLFVKPIVAGAATNMTVVTTLRRYAFDLRAHEPTGPNDPTIVYSVRFTYPDMRAAEPEPPPQPAAPQAINVNYSVRGTERFGDVHVFDDGAMTYFQFPREVEVPAIFVVNERNEEELVNTQARPPFVVVDHVARQFVLRSGRHRLRVRNESFGQTAALAPAEAQGSQP